MTDAAPEDAPRLFHIGDVARRAVRLLLNDLVAIILIMLGFVAVTESLLFVWSSIPTQPLQYGWLIIGNLLYALLLFSLMQGFLIHRLMQQLSPEPSSIWKTVTSVRLWFWPVLAAGVLSSIGIVFGLLLLIIPGVILACGWYLFIPVILREGLGSIDALGRSWHVTYGYKHILFVIIFVPILADMLITLLMFPIEGAVYEIFILIYNSVMIALIAALTVSSYYQILWIRREI